MCCKNPCKYYELFIVHRSYQLCSNMDGQIQGQGSEIEWFHDESASIKQGLLGGLFGVETTNWIGEESCILGIVNVVDWSRGSCTLSAKMKHYICTVMV